VILSHQPHPSTGREITTSATGQGGRDGTGPRGWLIRAADGWLPRAAGTGHAPPARLRPGPAASAQPPPASALAPGRDCRRRCGPLHPMVPLLSRDRARAGTVTCAIAHAAGALRALPGRVDGSAAAAGRPRYAQPGLPREANPGQPPARTHRDFPERDHPLMTRDFQALTSRYPFRPGFECKQNSCRIRISERPGDGDHSSFMFAIRDAVIESTSGRPSAGPLRSSTRK
jgi:hypothetical protein